MADELGMELSQHAQPTQPHAHDDDYDDWEDEPATAAPAPVAHEPADDEEDDDDEDEAPVDQPVPPRRELDQDVLGILREEAERETDARRTESGSLESQPDLGIDDRNSTGGLRERMARLRGADDDVAVAAGAAAASGKRRDLLPDIEEINSTLRSDEMNRSGEDDEEYDRDMHRPRGGFGLGFGVMILIALVIVGLYSFAPRLALMMPALDAPLTTYVEIVNDVRVWLDSALQGTVQKLTTLLSQLTSG